MLKKHCLSLMVLLLLVNIASAGVSLKNGNFFIGYTDIVYSGGFEPKVERVYNSKTPYRGIFGHGWGWEYEAYLSIFPDSVVIVHEYGGGADNRFAPEQVNKEGYEAGINTLVKVAQDKKDIKGQSEIDDYRARLRKEYTFFVDEWEKYRKLKLVSTPDIPLGTVLFSSRFGSQKIKRVKDGYIRDFDNGRREQYNNDGRITRITDKNGNYIGFTYDTNSNLKSLVDNFGRKINFTVNNRGLMEKVEGDGRVAVYRYDERDDLVYSKDVDGNVYEFQYDREYHNLQKIIYSDKTTMEMTYHPRDKNLNIKSVKDRDGTLTTYNYLFTQGDKLRYKIEVEVKGSDNSFLSKSSYEYFHKSNEQGVEWLHKLIQNMDGDVTETEYNSGGYPVSIKRNSEETKFEYDSSYRVTRKETPGDITELKYDPRVGKVIHVSRTSKASKQSTWSSFKYDAAGNLIYAENYEKKTVSLEYDANGRISVLTDQNKNRIEFTYNNNSKPIEIRRVIGDKVEKIIVTYTPNGEIEKAESPAGRAIALAVTTAFQNLLELIRPAGVSLSF